MRVLGSGTVCWQFWKEFWKFLKYQELKGRHKMRSDNAMRLLKLSKQANQWEREGTATQEVTEIMIKIINNCLSQELLCVRLWAEYFTLLHWIVKAPKFHFCFLKSSSTWKVLKYIKWNYSKILKNAYRHNTDSFKELAYIMKGWDYNRIPWFCKV